MTGTLKGYDALMNLVLDEVEEVMRGKAAPSPDIYRDSLGTDMAPCRRGRK